MSPAMTLTVTAAKPATTAAPEPTAHVEVWFGPHRIIDWEGDPADAPKIAAGLQRRYAGLSVRKADGSDW